MSKYVNKVVDLYTKTKVKESMKDEFHKWLIDDEFASGKEDALFRLWKQTDNVVTEDTFASLASLQAKSEFRPEKKSIKLGIWRYAVAVTLIVSVTFAYILSRKSPSDTNLVEYFSPAGQSDIIILPDGSMIHTNSMTVILYPESFGNNNRTIYLLGEANFKVKKNPNIPFIVKSNNFSVTALGTEFDVSSYPEDAYFKATLITGSIKVQQNDNQEEHILKVNEQFILDKRTKRHTIIQADMFEATAWQRGELVFRGATIKEILDVLERNYTVSFQYKSNAFNDDKYNFRFKKESTLLEIIDIIKMVADNFDYKKIGDSYHVTQ